MFHNFGCLFGIFGVETEEGGNGESEGLEKGSVVYICISYCLFLCCSRWLLFDFLDLAG